MMGLIQLIRSVDLRAVTVPTLIIYSPNDQIVDGTATEAAFTEIGAEHKQLVRYTDAEAPSQHVLAGHILSPASTERIFRLIVDFLGGS